MTFRLRRDMISETGPGFAVDDGDGNTLPGRWATYDDAYRQGYLGVYFLSGAFIVELVDVGGELRKRRR